MEKNRNFVSVSCFGIYKCTCFPAVPAAVRRASRLSHGVCVSPTSPDLSFLSHPPRCDLEPLHQQVREMTHVGIYLILNKTSESSSRVRSVGHRSMRGNLPAPPGGERDTVCITSEEIYISPFIT